jgi:hypothetical protein
MEVKTGDSAMCERLLTGIIALLALGTAANSQTLSATDYAKQFYSSVPSTPKYSSRVNALIRACKKRDPGCEYEGVIYMGQDMDGPAANLSAKIVSQKGNSAVVRVSYADNKGPVEVTYWLLRSGDSWVIDEIKGKGRGICDGLRSSLRKKGETRCK